MPARIHEHGTASQFMNTPHDTDLGSKSMYEKAAVSLTVSEHIAKYVQTGLAFPNNHEADEDGKDYDVSHTILYFFKKILKNIIDRN